MNKNILLILLAVITTLVGISQEEKKILIFTKNGKGYVHDNITASIEAIMKISKENNIKVDTSTNSSVFTDKNLKQYDALIFSNTNNEVFDTDEQKIAFIRYTEAGGGFVGIHSTCATERDWHWFQQVVGGNFVRHAPFQKFTIKIIDPEHTSTDFFTSDWVREDECYYVNNINPDIHVLLAADLATVEDKGKETYPANTFSLFPLAWYHEFDGGRQWFTALGHSIDDYSMPLFVQHITGGILWAVEKGKPDYSKAKSVNLK
jgi:uncharacterized protein